MNHPLFAAWIHDRASVASDFADWLLDQPLPLDIEADGIRLRAFEERPGEFRLWLTAPSFLVPWNQVEYQSHHWDLHTLQEFASIACLPQVVTSRA